MSFFKSTNLHKRTGEFFSYPILEVALIICFSPPSSQGLLFWYDRWGVLSVTSGWSVLDFSDHNSTHLLWRSRINKLYLAVLVSRPLMLVQEQVCHSLIALSIRSKYFSSTDMFWPLFPEDNSVVSLSTADFNRVWTIGKLANPWPVVLQTHTDLLRGFC